MLRQILLVITLFSAVLIAQDKKILTYEAFADLRRVDEPAVSPDGNWVLYNVRKYSLESNTYTSNIFLTSVDGKTSRQLTFSPTKDITPIWSPDGKTIAFLSNRLGGFQIWTMALDGGEPKRVTNLSTQVSGNGLVWSPNGQYILFTSDVFPDCETDDCNRAHNDAAENSKVKAQLIDKLPFRVWDSFKDGKRSQLLLLEVATGKISDMIAGDYDVPPIDLGGAHDFGFSPDGKTIIFTMNTDPKIAWSTNNDVWTMPVIGGEPKKISTSPGVDNNGVYSPDGKYIAYCSMERAGYEADQTDLKLYEVATGKTKNLTEKFDRSVGTLVWSRDGKSIYFDAEDQGYHPVFQISVSGGEPKKITTKTFDLLSDVAQGAVIVRRSSMRMPSEIFAVSEDGKKSTPLSNVNTAKLAALEMAAPEEFWFIGANNTPVHGFLVKPPKFDPAQKYPVVYLVHGGPQNAWNDTWSWRWNPMLFAAPGYVVVMVNPRGSTGYGQQFTDEIRMDWGGKPYEDLMKGMDYICSTYSFIDKDRIGAAGGSYGGYMMNWMNGHTDRFKCFVSHASIMNKFNMYGGTEEMWFDEWEMGGPYWEGANRETFEKWSPYNYVQNFKTPTLVVHGELDYRVPVIEGVNLFQVLQRKGIPSKFLYYPDEGHWILKPQNGRLWYQTVHTWFDQWLRQPAP
ncbi:S9 family peptidase [bacterium]|nr:S9 family peptidase [bacterium]NUN44958.1 S9 family peptidase [bacterium]